MISGQPTTSSWAAGWVINLVVAEWPSRGQLPTVLDGAHLRTHHLVTPPASITIDQGEDMGRPCKNRVDIPLAGGIHLTGTTVPIVP